MSHNLASQSPDTETILCCYVNATSKIQVARITNIPNWYFERVVFPGQRLMFEASPDANLEIHSGMMASAILSDTIACTKLSVDEPTELHRPSPGELQVLEYRNEGLVEQDSTTHLASISQ